jgi:hypothetical protein
MEIISWKTGRILTTTTFYLYFRYSITNAGCELAHKILAAEQLQGLVNNHVENVPQFTIGATTPVKKRKQPTAAAGSPKKTPKKK